MGPSIMNSSSSLGKMMATKSIHIFINKLILDNIGYDPDENNPQTADL